MPKTYKVLLSRHARNDLAEIYDYIGADSPKKATAFILVLEEKILSLAIFPKRVPLIPENILLGTNYRHLIHEKYRVIFRIQAEIVVVLRVIHGARLLKL